jgi:murein DD-endopeptidase MepM/ murein hydrolase activator NlpD
VPAKRKLTVIVIPETGKQTRTFQFSPLWLVALGLVVLGLSATVAYQAKINEALTETVQTVDDLKRANRLQETEIETLRAKTAASQQKLLELEGLEREIQELTGDAAPSRSGLQSDLQPLYEGGRGGPPLLLQPLENLPTLGAMLPPEVRGHLFARRDTLPLDLKQPSAAELTPKETLAQAEAIQMQLDTQLSEMDRLALTLAEGKQAIEERLDYLAHRPTGYPVSGALLTDRFGTRWSPFGWGRQRHEGIDLAHSYGEPVVSTGAGVVIQAGWKDGGYGRAVMIDHGYGFVTMYAHLTSSSVEVGDTVERGQVIGRLGSTGLSTGPHVHYEVHLNGTPVDPLKYSQ